MKFCYIKRRGGNGSTTSTKIRDFEEGKRV